jgi:predicted nucleotidyltransferase
VGWRAVTLAVDARKARIQANRIDAEASPMGARKTERAIKQMVRRIAERFDPERIILFGSHARGHAGPDSDVDLLVVMPVRGSKHEQQLEIRRVLRGVGTPVDIVVSTPEEFEWRQEIVGTIEHPAVTEGRLLYART